MAIREYPFNKRIFLDGTRLEKPFQKYLIAQDAFSLATDALAGRTPPERGSVRYNNCRPGLDIALPGPYNFRFAAEQVDHAQLWFVLLNSKDNDENIKSLNHPENKNLAPMKSIMNDSATTQFILFYDLYWDFVWSTANHAREKISPVWAFARVVRNAIGHGNRVNITDNTFKPVSWYSIRYGPDENGKIVIGNDLDAPDILILLIEMDHELEDLGYGPSLTEGFQQVGIVYSHP